MALPHLLADRIEPAHGLQAMVIRGGFTPPRDRGRLLADVVAAMIAERRGASDLDYSCG